MTVPSIDEATPLEFGAFDANLAHFIDMSYLGSSSINSKAVCVNNFDNAGFILGASSCLFDAYNVTANIAWTIALSPGEYFSAPRVSLSYLLIPESIVLVVYEVKEIVNQTFFARQPEQQIDIASTPNPFYGLSPGSYQDSDQTELRLVDGGLDGANTPILPMLVLAREVDVILVADAVSRPPSIMFPHHVLE